MTRRFWGFCLVSIALTASLGLVFAREQAGGAGRCPRPRLRRPGARPVRETSIASRRGRNGDEAARHPLAPGALRRSAITPAPNPSFNRLPRRLLAATPRSNSGCSSRSSDAHRGSPLAAVDAAGGAGRRHRARLRARRPRGAGARPLPAGQRLLPRSQSRGARPTSTPTSPGASCSSRSTTGRGGALVRGGAAATRTTARRCSAWPARVADDNPPLAAQVRRSGR